MKYMHLIWAALFRSKTRTFLTLLSVVAAFLLFGLLDSVRVAFTSTSGVAGADRLVIASKLSLTQMLPYSLGPQIETTRGVKSVVYAAWFGGIYQEPKNFFPNFSVGPNYLDMFPEFLIPDQQRKAWEGDQSGAIVGEALARKYKWKIGDTIPLQATIFPTKGSNTWTFRLDGIFHLADQKLKGQEQQLFFHWKYFDEGNDFVKSKVGWYVVRLNSINQAARVSKAIDALSENSDHETKSQSESDFQMSFVKQLANVGLIVSAIMGAVFFTLLLLTGNTMGQAVRERIPELAVLKTIGFSNRSLLLLVLAESVLLIVLGGLIGLGLASVMGPVVGTLSDGQIQLPALPPSTWWIGLGLMVLIGVIVGLLPAMRAMRLNIVDALAGR
jgi:putative ABC transport system permease protein